jgi:hypothetical protein
MAAGARRFLLGSHHGQDAGARGGDRAQRCCSCRTDGTSDLLKRTSLLLDKYRTMVISEAATAGAFRCRSRADVRPLMTMISLSSKGQLTIRLMLASPQ